MGSNRKRQRIEQRIRERKERRTKRRRRPRVRAREVKAKEVVATWMWIKEEPMMMMPMARRNEGREPRRAIKRQRNNRKPRQKKSPHQKRKSDKEREEVVRSPDDTQFVVLYDMMMIAGMSIVNHFHLKLTSLFNG